MLLGKNISNMYFNEVYFGLLGEETTNRIVFIYCNNAQRDKVRTIDYITLWQTFCNNILPMMKQLYESTSLMKERNCKWVFFQYFGKLLGQFFCLWAFLKDDSWPH
jgi:hypothetical protein